MKLNLFALLFISCLILTACSTTRNSELATDETTSDFRGGNYTSLADYLRSNSNVSVNGVDPNIRLQIRGVNSLTSDTRPFIYVDNSPFGRDYAKVNNFINPNQIKRVVVLSSLAELITYGQEGHSGIIKISTKTNR